MQLTYLKDYLAGLKESSPKAKASSSSKCELTDSDASTTTNQLPNPGRLNEAPQESEQVFECGICWEKLAESKKPSVWSEIKA